MKIVFLDFDGVLNSSASFKMESRKTKEQRGMPVNQTLCHVCCSNFQYILDSVPDAKIVISSTWRELFELDWLKEKLASYGIDSSKVIDKTPALMSGRGFNRADRGVEIKDWLDKHPEVTQYVILDDNFIGAGMEQDGMVVKTKWESGLQLIQAMDAIWGLGGKIDSEELPD